MLSVLFAWLRIDTSSERGQDLIEYAMLGGLIAIALAAGALVFSGALASMSTGISHCIDFNSGTTCAPF
jgi:Flp pilus assembly pilin Flp